MKFPRTALVLVTFSTVFVTGCASQAAKNGFYVPATLTLPAKTAATHIDGLPEEAGNLEAPTFRQTPTPTPTTSSSAYAVLGAEERLPRMGNQPVSINVQDVPVPVLANEIFGSLLGLNVNLAAEVSSLDSLVTLNTRDQVAPVEMFRIARQILAEYGVAVTVEGDLVRVQLAPSGSTATPPLIISGRAMPDVPISHRPIYQLVELEVVRSNEAQRWLTTIFGQELRMTEDVGRNALLISGKPAQVRQALDALRVFDRPIMRGRVSSRLEPAFLTAEQLTNSLSDVLTMQGYGVTRSPGSPASVIVLPIAAANTVLLFATTRESLDYAIAWARELDRPGKTAGQASMFYYQVRNTKAADIAAVLSGGAPAGSRDETQAGSSASGRAGAAAPSSGANSEKSGAFSGPLLVDEPRNALIYQGAPEQWDRMLTLIKQMDRTPRQVMIEVTIAEVTLNDDVDYGLTWFAKNGFGRFDGNIFKGSGSGTNAAPRSASGGLTYLLDVAGQNRVALTAFANDNRVNILSTPRLLVKSGNEANIDVGTEVPTVSMTTTSNQQTGGSTNLLQSIQYRKTGIILRVKPTVYSDDRIDLEIEQEVSEVLPLEADSTANSPSIFNRSLSTSLSLRDGGSVVMAGLISDKKTNIDAGIPGLKDVPLIGGLFKNKAIKKSRTELVLIIVPYIVESDDRADQLSRAVVEKFELLNLDQIFAPKAPSEPHPALHSQPATGVLPRTLNNPD